MLRTFAIIGACAFIAAPYCRAGAATVAVTDRDGYASIDWRGDERVSVRVSKTAGVLGAPIEVRVGERRITLGGFYAAFSGPPNGIAPVSASATLSLATSASAVVTCAAPNRVLVEHQARCEGLAQAVPLRFAIWMEPGDKCVRVKVSYPEGRFHLDRLGLLPHQGDGLAPKRIFMGRMLVMDGPFEPFNIKHDYNLTRYWCFTMANGLTEMQGTDRVPRGFACDPGAGLYDEYTYCDSPITYTFAFTGKGPQEAFAQYRRTVTIPAPSSLGKLPGRCLIMTSYPIKERYEDFLEELTSRGMRDFIWLSYCPSPSDRKMLEPYGALYAIYDMYTDLFDSGIRGAKGWSPKQVIYTRPGRMMRGYWHATRLLPELYVWAATRRIQATLGREMANRGFLKTFQTRYSNLAISKRELHPTALYLDVHSSKTPMHYYDWRGVHHPARAYMYGEKALFDFARSYLGNVPILSEGNGEAFAGIMDGGIFMDWPTPATLNVPIKCADWDYYPDLDQVHRSRLLPVGFHWPLNEPNTEEMNLAMLFGRLHSINAYWGTSLDNPGRRVQVYYETSAFHRMLGLSRIDHIDLVDDSIHRAIVHYSNGATAWVNRSTSNWDVRGYLLPPKGFLVVGPQGYLGYRALKDGKAVDAVESREYCYYASDAQCDFGAVSVNGSVAVRVQPDRVMVYELVKPRGAVSVDLAKLSPSLRGARISRAYIRFNRNRRVPLRYPDVDQKGSIVTFSPVFEIPSVAGYELVLAPQPASHRPVRK